LSTALLRSGAHLEVSEAEDARRVAGATSLGNFTQQLTNCRCIGWPCSSWER